MDNPVRVQSSPLNDSELDGALAVSIVDNSTVLPIWTLLVSKNLFKQLEEKDALSSVFLGAFSEFPPIQF